MHYYATMMHCTATEAMMQHILHYDNKKTFKYCSMISELPFND